MWVTYILLSAIDKKHYIGSTNDLERRLHQHNSKQVTATAPRAPFSLISYTTFNTEKKAREFEKYLKTGSGWSFINKRIL